MECAFIFSLPPWVKCATLNVFSKFRHTQSTARTLFHAHPLMLPCPCPRPCPWHRFPPCHRSKGHVHHIFPSVFTSTLEPFHNPPLPPLHGRCQQIKLVCSWRVPWVLCMVVQGPIQQFSGSCLAIDASNPIVHVPIAKF